MVAYQVTNRLTRLEPTLAGISVFLSQYNANTLFHPISTRQLLSPVLCYLSLIFYSAPFHSIVSLLICSDLILSYLTFLFWFICVSSCLISVFDLRTLLCLLLPFTSLCSPFLYFLPLIFLFIDWSIDLICSRFLRYLSMQSLIYPCVIWSLWYWHWDRYRDSRSGLWTTRWGTQAITSGNVM